jgi:hypothetical protein
LDADATSATGILLEFTLGEEAERWPIDQSRALVPVLRGLVRRAENGLFRAA